MTCARLVGLFIAVGCYQPPPASPRPQPPNVSPVATGARSPQASGTGAYLAVWDDDRLGGDHGARAVFGTRISADGTILDPSGIALEDRFTAFETNPVAVATSSGWLAAWQRLDSDVEHKPTEIWARRVGHDGVARPLLAVSGIGRHYDAQVAAAGDDVMVVWWRTDPPMVQASLITGDTMTRLSFGKPTMSVHPGVAFDAKTNQWLIVWRDAIGGISGVRVDRNGNLLDDPRLVIAKDKKPTWDLGPRVASNDDGEFFVTWASGDDMSIMGVRVDAATGSPRATPATLTSSPSKIFRHAIGATPDGFALTWIDMPKGERTLQGLWLGNDGSRAPLVIPAQPGIGYSPAFQHTANGLLASWHQSPEPRAALVGARGRIDATPLVLRSMKAAPLPASTLTAGLDAVAANGADYCGTSRDRKVPGRVTGVLVEEGEHAWGWVHAPGFGWGYPPAGIEPGWKFHVGRDWAFAPKLSSRAGGNGVSMPINIPDGNRHRVEHMMTEHPSRAGLEAVGVEGPISLIDIEVNGGLGGMGTHFVITKVHVLDGPATLGARLAKLRTRFDATVAAHKQAIDQLLAAEDAKLKASIKHPIVSKMQRTSMVVYDPTWRPSTKRLEVQFGYKVDGGYVVDMPASDDGFSKRESRRAGSMPQRYSVYMGVRYTLDGDRVLTEELFVPRVPTRQAPWDCVAADPPRPVK